VREGEERKGREMREWERGEVMDLRREEEERRVSFESRL